MINDKKRLSEVLPDYFRTSKVVSFIRQLYIYNFRTVKRNRVKEYHNPDFVRGRYSEIVKVKKRDQLIDDTNDSDEDFRAEYIKLSKNYDELWMAVLDLKEKTNELIAANHAMIIEELNNRFDFVDRIKSNLIAFIIQVMHYDNQSNELIKKRIEKHSADQALANPNKFKSFNEIDDTTDAVKREIHSAFFNPTDKKSHIAKVLQIVLRSFNKRYFNMEFDKFYDIVVRLFVRDEEPLHLYRLPNYHMLKKIKKYFDEFIDIILKNYFSEHVKPLYLKIQCQKDLEVLTSKDEFRAKEKAISDSFSVRTLRNQLGFMDLDLFMYLGADLE